ncbi:hypothetical protein GBAR_LOCUS28310, partial [Geodia barretti]
DHVSGQSANSPQSTDLFSLDPSLLLREVSSFSMAEPPPYEEATKAEGTATHLMSAGETEPPPAYNQLFGISDLKEAKKQSSNRATFVVKSCEIVTGTVACAICMGILAALPISMIIIGKHKFHRTYKSRFTVSSLTPSTAPLNYQHLLTLCDLRLVVNLIYPFGRHLHIYNAQSLHKCIRIYIIMLYINFCLC